MPYRYEYTSAADRGLARLSSTNQERAIRRVRQLAEEPRGRHSKQLKGRPIRWSSPVGSLRIVYSIDDEAQTILIEAVGNRDVIYEIARRRR